MRDEHIIYVPQLSWNLFSTDSELLFEAFSGVLLLYGDGTWPYCFTRSLVSGYSTCVRSPFAGSTWCRAGIFSPSVRRLFLFYLHELLCRARFVQIFLVKEVIRAY